jgi:hypothetical protein
MGFPRNPDLRAVRSLPRRLMFALACVLINVLALAVIAIAVHRAPEGYEDETGFHFTDRVVPRSKGRESVASADSRRNRLSP